MTTITQVLPALLGLAGVIIGALVASWRQGTLQTYAWRREELRRWQQDRRAAYMQFVNADDELYRSLLRDIRDPPPGRVTDDQRIMGVGEVMEALTPDERTAVLSAFDKVWRAKREIELHHLLDDELLGAANRLSLKDAELVGLIVYDLTRRPSDIVEVNLQIHSALNDRRRLIDVFMVEARKGLDVPASRTNR